MIVETTLCIWKLLIMSQSEGKIKIIFLLYFVKIKYPFDLKINCAHLLIKEKYFLMELKIYYYLFVCLHFVTSSTTSTCSEIAPRLIQLYYCKAVCPALICPRLSILKKSKSFLFLSVKIWYKYNKLYNFI